MLETTIDVQSGGDAVTFTVRAENRSDEAVELSFSDSQRVRISVYPAESGDDAGEDGEPTWRSDEGQMFMQVLGGATVPADGSLEFQEEWNNPESGTYRAVGEVVCDDRKLEDETAFSV